MHFTTLPIAALLAFATLPGLSAASPSPNPDVGAVSIGVGNAINDARNWAACVDIDAGETVKAIDAFCSKSNMMVPSPYARAGRHTSGAIFSVTGTCSPAQWVPSYWCGVQLREVCRAVLDGGLKPHTFTFGRNNCQHFSMSSTQSREPWAH